MSKGCDCPPFDCRALITRILAGEREAGGELYQKFRPLVRAIVARVLGEGRADEHEDACQAVFERVLSRLGKWEARCPFCKWLAVVAARRATDLRRLRPLATLDEPDSRPAAEPPPPALEPEEMDCIQRKLATFHRNWRQVWEMHISDVPHAEIARTLDMSLRAVQYWLAEMRDRLRECLA